MTPNDNRHTPGEWFWEGGKLRASLGERDPIVDVAFATGDRKPFIAVLNDHDRHLIAAAKAMYEACDLLSQIIGDCNDVSDLLDGYCPAARHRLGAALAKASGGEG